MKPTESTLTSWFFRALYGFVAALFVKQS